MSALIRISSVLNRLAETIGKTAAYTSLLLLFTILFDVVLRRYFVFGSAKLQELEWHLHGLLFLLCLGYAYSAGAHVRIDIWREKCSIRTRLWVELVGIVLLLIPFTVVAAKFSFDYASLSFAKSEISASLAGLSHRWLIKGAVTVGLLLLCLTAVGQALQIVVCLFSRDACAACTLPSAVVGDVSQKV